MLNNEIKNKAEAYQNRFVKTIYFGGGTPSSVDEKHIIEVLENISAQFVVDENAEITIECNPCTVDKEKLSKYKKAGFNRVSFGVQSLDINHRHLHGFTSHGIK
jgi:oxygen-independent coproporphyrinogen-3 oxidase